MFSIWDSAYRSRIAASSGSLWQTHVKCETAGQPGLPLNPDDQVMGSLSRRTSGAVGHRNERGLEGLQLRDRLEQLVRGLVSLGREELKAERVRRARKTSWMCMVGVTVSIAWRPISSVRVGFQDTRDQGG